MSKTIIDYLKENDKFEIARYSLDGNGHEIILYIKDDVITMELAVHDNDKHSNDKFEIVTKGNNSEYEIQDILEQYGIEIRFCNECGKPYDAGFMGGDGEWYCCEDCFEPMMDRNFGKGKWRPTEKEGRYGGYYEYLTDSGKWEDTGAFYTEWN